MVWGNIHEDAPTDDEDRPIHPEKGYPICGYEKTDAEDVNGRKREEYAYCLLAAGWGVEDRKTGHCTNHGGNDGGAPEGWRNGNARHLLYSKRMNEDDQAEFEALVETSDGDRIGVEEMGEMLETMIGFEYMRLARAVDKTPGVEQVTIYECPTCGKNHRATGPADGSQDVYPPGGECDGQLRTGPQEIVPCPYTGPLEPVPGKSFVEFGDKAVERKEAKIANLIATYKQVSQGTDVNVKGDHDVSVEGGDTPVSVNITSVGVDLPEDADDPDDGDEDDGGDE